MPKKKKIYRKSRFEVIHDSYISVHAHLSAEEQLQLANKLLNEKSNSYFPTGTSAYYVFSYQHFGIIAAENNISEITGVPLEELLKKPANETLGALIVPEHSHSAARFAEIAFRVMATHDGQDLFINTEYEILKRKKKRVRLLFQFRPEVYNGSGLPLLIGGHVSDITFQSVNCPAHLTILLQNQVYAHFRSSREELLAGLSLPLTLSEVNVLQLKKQGLRTKEISHLLHIKEMTVYAMIRDIKKKTGMEILPLIGLLEEKGVL